MHGSIRAGLSGVVVFQIRVHYVAISTQGRTAVGINIARAGWGPDQTAAEINAGAATTTGSRIAALVAFDTGRARRWAPLGRDTAQFRRLSSRL